MCDSLRPYAIVEFKEPCGGTSNNLFAAAGWLDETRVYWPNVTLAKIFKLLRECTDPDETRWQCYNCHLLGTAGRFCMQSYLVIYMCCNKNIKYLSTLKYFVQMIYKALDKSQDWLNYPAISTRI